LFFVDFHHLEVECIEARVPIASVHDNHPSDSPKLLFHAQLMRPTAWLAQSKAIATMVLSPSSVVGAKFYILPIPGLCLPLPHSLTPHIPTPPYICPDGSLQSKQQALARLRAYKPPPTQWYNCPLTRRAAVLILLFPDRHGALNVVLTLRSAALTSYAGQVAFPGGKSDTLAETPWATARREAFEEIGLPLDDALQGFRVEELCELPTNLARTELGVRPCVAYLSPDEGWKGGMGVPRLDPKEVAEVFAAPFHAFLRKELEGEEVKERETDGRNEKWYRGSWTDWHESRWRMHNFYVPRVRAGDAALVEKQSKASAEEESMSSTHGQVQKGDEKKSESSALDALTTFRVWGMTSRIIVDAARIAYGEDPEFEFNQHYGDEDMIERLLKMGRMSEIRKKGEVLTKEVLREASKSKM
jgi:8-oxo-dGTP pyrophosphatase MutT (NUDIX family)